MGSICIYVYMYICIYIYVGHRGCTDIPPTIFAIVAMISEIIVNNLESPTENLKFEVFTSFENTGCPSLILGAHTRHTVGKA